MEKMVASKEYFMNSVWLNVAPHIQPDTLYLEKIFKTKATNRHSPDLNLWEEIFDRWPQLFKEIFYKVSNIITIDRIKRNYAVAGYTLPI